MTTVFVTQPVYMPPVWWIHRALQADTVVLLDNAQFTPKHRGPDGTGRTWQNCCQILTAQGPLTLTVPTAAKRRPINETPVDGVGWRDKHLRAYDLAYARAPHHGQGRQLLEQSDGRHWELISDQPTITLGDVTAGSSADVLERFGRTYVYASEIDFGDDPPTGTRWMLELAQAAGADTYLAGAIAAANYLDLKAFQDAGISVKLHRYDPVPYPQVHQFTGFVPNLSVLDLVANVGLAQAAWHLTKG